MISIYSIDSLKAEGKSIKYLAVEKVEKLKAPSTVAKKEPKEQYITPVTAKIVEDYEMPKQKVKIKPPTIDDTVDTTEFEKELGEKLGDKTPFEIMAEKELKKPKEIPPEREEVIKKAPKIPEPEIPEPAKIIKDITPKTKPATVKPIKIKPITIKPVKIKPVSVKPVIKPTVTPKITPPKPSKLIPVSPSEKKQLDKSIENVISRNEPDKI